MQTSSDIDTERAVEWQVGVWDAEAVPSVAVEAGESPSGEAVDDAVPRGGGLAIERAPALMSAAKRHH